LPLFQTVRYSSRRSANETSKERLSGIFWSCFVSAVLAGKGLRPWAAVGDDSPNYFRLWFRRYPGECPRKRSSHQTWTLKNSEKDQLLGDARAVPRFCTNEYSRCGTVVGGAPAGLYNFLNTISLSTAYLHPFPPTIGKRTIDPAPEWHADPQPEFCRRRESSPGAGHGTRFV